MIKTNLSLLDFTTNAKMSDSVYCCLFQDLLKLSENKFMCSSTECAQHPYFDIDGKEELKHVVIVSLYAFHSPLIYMIVTDGF